MLFDPHTLQTLDFSRIRSALADCCASSLGIERADSLTPSTDADFIRYQLDCVEDALFSVSLNLGGIQDIRPGVHRSREGKQLDGKEILEVAYTLDAALTLKRAIAMNSKGPLLDVASSIGSHLGLVRSALEKLDRDGSVRDDASPKLRQIRRRLNPLRNEIRQKMQDVLERWGDMLQENLITIRRDRFVVPIKASFVNQVQGIIIDASASGQTYFVEPGSVVPLNNELTRLLIEEDQEVRRILMELSGQIALEEGLDMTMWALGELDLIAAKARLARDWELSRPEKSEAGSYHLQDARHPLIEKPVANDLHLDSSTRLLLITGPNMGGKTATLKTLGLIVLMHQCGMYVPARVAKLPVVDGILVDIGDEQSIQESLSTFASHLKHLKYVLDHASPDTLILVDELGSGTDPSEGAALAQALIAELLKKNTRGIITSHLAPLKLYAMEIQGLQNASMGFSLENLGPTYHLQVGQPGRSYALSIARRMGLPEAVLSEATEILGPEGNKVEKLLENLEQERETIRNQREQLESLRQEANLIRNQLAFDRDRIHEERDELILKAREQADQIYRDAIETVRKMRSKAQDDVSRPKVLEELKELRRASMAERPQPKVEPALEQVRPGSVVDVPAYGASGQVLEVRGDELVVQLGVLKITVRRRDVRFKQQEKQKVASLTTAGFSRFNKEINLRGKSGEEAIEELRSYVAEAYALKETPLRVVHGKGQGVLRRMIRDFLKNEKTVESYHDAEPYNGGHGVTIVNIRTK
ncbi:endonuclease MutS2 [Deinococcus roseus]|uniref:endonuclease MutS2 n=1 Tax=Deinococcus roseus TaxID=392414 RepID=UPI00166F5EDE|nr:endonuclease MutS2 [Deinococcus roseus]